MSSHIDYPKRPQIYVYSATGQPGLKIGYTERVTKSGSDFEAVDKRIREGLVKTPVKQYKIEHYESAITKSGKVFKDHLVHEWLKKHGSSQIAGEFYDASLAKVKSIIKAIKEEQPENASIRQDFRMRPEQEKFVQETAAYFRKYDKETSQYLWNAKMRFGKTFTSYQLAKAMGWTRILVLTYKPGVEKEWQKDLYRHKDFEGWQFIEGLSSWEENGIDESRPVVWFASFQDVIGHSPDGEIKDRHKKMREIEWDCIYVDEYHFGAWRDAAKELYQDDKSKDTAALPEDYNESAEIRELPLKSKRFLYLSGTPFRALTEGEFTEDQISNWTYADEQKAKRDYDGPEPNPYAELPKIVMLTYQMPESLREVAMQGEFNEFDLNTFFAAKKEGDKYIFERGQDVQKFLNILHGINLEVAVENRFDHKTPALPFEDARLLSSLRHTFWFLPTVAACKAMEEMLNADPFFNQYTIIRAAGSDTPGGKDAKTPVELAIKDGLDTKTITLSCGKLTTGVTIPAWSGVLFLRNTDKPETYFQTAFRAQSPFAMQDAEDPMKKNVLKPTCYVLDFAPSRALKLMADYSEKLAVGDSRRPEERLSEFTEFLPVLCYDGVSMKQLKATDILDIANYGTASTMLARRWQSDRLIDTTTIVLEKILDNEDILAALERIENFRNIKNDLSRVITSEKALKEAKKERIKTERKPTKAEQAEEAEKEKENRTFKQKLRKKLKSFVTRVPVFMYLTDYREHALIDVIRNLEPELFTKVTGLTIKEFDLMCEVGVFRHEELDAAIAMFRRFEDASLVYAGGRKANDSDEKIGLFDTVVTRAEADEIITAEV